MYILKFQLKLIEAIKSLAGHLPHPIASWLDLLAENWRTQVQLDMLRQLERMRKDIDLLRKEAAELQAITRKMKNHQPREDRDDKD